MSARVEWSGLEELKAALRKMPEDLAGEASGIVMASANEAGRRITDLYPTQTGALKDGVSTSKAQTSAGRFGAGAVVVSRAKHAWLYDNGSQARHTANGYNRGSMPPKHTFVRTVMQYRRSMYEKLKDMLRRKGLEVSGEP